MNSKLFNLNLKDVIKGFVLAVITSVVAAIYQIVQEGNLPELPQLKTIALAGLAAGIAYLMKNLFSNNNGDFAKKDGQVVPPPPTEQKK
jgi:hypothetical protein